MYVDRQKSAMQSGGDVAHERGRIASAMAPSMCTLINTDGHWDGARPQTPGARIFILEDILHVLYTMHMEGREWLADLLCRLDQST